MFPFFSIVIPTYNRPGQLMACLESLTRLDYPQDRLEVIVVDDGGSSGAQSVVDPFQRRLNLSLLSQSHQGPASARNSGALRAAGEFIAFTDDDCMPAPDWLRFLALRFAESPDCMIGGRTVNALTGNLCSAASQMLISYLYEYYNVDAGHARFFASNNLAARRALFLEMDGFDATYPRAAAEDREFSDRWLCSGHRMLYEPQAVVYHAHNLTIIEFWRQHYNYGRGAWCFRRACARRQGSVRVEPLSFYFNLLRYPFTQRCGLSALIIGLLLAQSQVVNAAGFLLQGLGQRFR